MKPIPGWEGHYSVTDDGRVWSHKRHQWLKPRTDKRGYPFLNLRRPGYRTTQLVHRLVAAAFIPNPLALPQINHIDGCKTHNHATNLEWCTPTHNVKHSYRNGITPKRRKASQTNIRKAKQSAKHQTHNRRESLKFAAIRMQRRADALTALHPDAANQQSTP